MTTTQTHINSKTGEDITEIIGFLSQKMERSNFADSLYTQFFAKGFLSDKQIAAAERMMGEALVVETASPVAEHKIPEVPQGHYAIPNLTGSNDLDFFRVDRPTEGKWAGYTFVKTVVGGHPDYRVPFSTAKGILARIVDEGIEASAVRYGTEIGRCYACNRSLTDETSRTLGIGPECRKGR